jgi:hypothetical protein
MNTSPQCTHDSHIPHQPYWETGHAYGTQVLTNTMCEISLKERQQQLREKRRVDEWDHLRSQVPHMSEEEKQELYQDLLNAMSLDQRKEFEEILEKRRHDWGVAQGEEDEFICL